MKEAEGLRDLIRDDMDDAREKGRLPTGPGDCGLTELALQEAGQHFRAYDPGKSQVPALLA